MRLFKKLVSGIALTAMCCTLAVPMTASAIPGIGACPGHVFDGKEYVRTEIISTEDHVYITTEILPDGTIEPTVHTCIKQTLGHYYKTTCLECGYVKTIVEEKVQHLDLNCPERE